jgi:hypothetical protein
LPQKGAELRITRIVAHNYLYGNAVGGQGFWIEIGGQAIDALPEFLMALIGGDHD